MNNKYFCSESSRNANDNIAGTASFYDKILLIEYRGTFKQKAFEESSINKQIKEIINDFLNKNTNTKVLLVKRKKEIQSEKLSLFAASTKNNEFSQLFIDSYEEISFDLLNDLFSFKSKCELSTPMFMICTNGTKDKCCAKFGLPIWKEFDSKHDNSWQCSHIGGDRFAPTAFVIPSFSTYGHINITDVQNIISLEIEKKVFYNKLRGFASLNFYEQAVDIFLRKKHKLEEKESVKILSSEKISNNNFIVSAIVKTQKHNNPLRFHVEKTSNEHYDLMTCNATKKSFSFKFNISSITKSD